MAAQDLPIISVIVPMHNVAPYLHRCLKSIENQTLAGLEVIMIDDASTDNSAAIAMEYAEKHPFWHVIIFSENKGISAVRNVGVSRATGEYIGFVDADDWAAPTMFQTLYEMAVQTNADISQIGYELRTSEGPTPQANDNEVRVISGIDALEEMLLQETYAVWPRLYRRDLFHVGIEWFPVGLTCEDRIANSWLLPSATCVAVSNRIEYFYFLNLGSISYSGLDKRSLELLEADQIMIQHVDKLNSDRLSKLARDRAAKGPFSLLVKWARFGVTDAKLDAQGTLSNLRNLFNDNYNTLMASSLPISKKVVAWQLRHCPSLLKLEFSIHNTVGALLRGNQS